MTYITITTITVKKINRSTDRSSHSNVCSFHTPTAGVLFLSTHPLHKTHSAALCPHKSPLPQLHTSMRINVTRTVFSVLVSKKYHHCVVVYSHTPSTYQLITMSWTWWMSWTCCESIWPLFFVLFRPVQGGVCVYGGADWLMIMSVKRWGGVSFSRLFFFYQN